MPTFTHYYRCHCVDWVNNHFIEDGTTNPAPEYHGQQHFQLNNRVPCQRYLKHAKTQLHKEKAKVAPPAKDSVEYGISLATHQIGKVNMPTIAYMWESESQTWIYGKCKHGHGSKDATLAAVPNEIIKRIDAGAKLFDPEQYIFGWNCAEVECIIKAYSASTPRQTDDLKDCIFVAANSGREGSGNLMDACHSCRNWITESKGRYAKFSVQGYLGLS